MNVGVLDWDRFFSIIMGRDGQIGRLYIVIVAIVLIETRHALSLRYS